MRVCGAWEGVPSFFNPPPPLPSPPHSHSSGYWRAAAEKKVASFRLAYALDALRVGGDDVRLLYLEGAGWSVWRLDESAPTAGTLLADGLADRPPYDKLTELLRAAPGSASAAPLLERLKREIKFIQDSANQG